MGAAATINFNATVSGSVATPVVAGVTYDNGIFSSVSVAQSGNTYAVSGTTQSGLSLGTHNSSISFRLCQEAACTNVYSGATATHAVSLAVKRQEWSMYQRDAAHTGYVPARLDPARFTKAWEWNTPDHARFGGLVPVDDAVFVSAGRKVFRLSEAAGAQVWEYATPDPGGDWTGPPGYENGVVYFPIQPPPTGSFSTGASTIRGLDAATGVPKTESPFTSQGGPFNSPTFHDGAMYFSEGQYGNFAYRYDLPSGAVTWSSRLGFDNYAFNFNQTPAVDQNHVYHATENGIFIVDKSDGKLVATVPDKTFGSGAGGLLAPVITAGGLVLRVDITDNGRLIAIDPAKRSVAWRGPTVGGSAQPVTAGDMVYSWMPLTGWTVGAIDAKTGAVLWSWSLPATDTQLIENMVVCDNLLFVSSNKTIYAIDLATHQTSWTFAAHGKLSLSSNLVLYVLQSDFGIEDSRVTAIRLN